MTALSELGSFDDVRASATALVHGGRSWTYRELRAAADRLAEAMRADELSGERVALMLPNGPELVICYLACFSVGAIAAPLNARYAPPEVAQALQRARPRWLIAHPDRRATLEQVDRAVRSDLRVIVVGETDSVFDGAGRSATALSPGVAPDTPAVIFFTSGSTGRPKGVVHSHASTSAMLTSTSEALGDVGTDDVVQVFEPLVHVSGFIATFTSLLAGGTAVLYDGFDPTTYTQALRTHRPTLVSTHIDVLSQLLRVPGVRREWFSSLRGVYTGGDTVPAAVQREFHRVSGLPISVGYGMTEAIWLTVQRTSRTDRAGCIGRPLNDVRLRVDNATGELLVSGPMVMQRYWEDEALTAATVVDGWLHTGDLASCDADGVWWFTGRLKDIIVRRTSKITPGEVETALEQHPDVAMAAVVGMPDPDEGQVPVAFVVPRAETDVSTTDLVAFLADRIAAYKIPARIHLRSSLPLTATGKISRRDLLEPSPLIRQGGPVKRLPSRGGHR